MCYIWNIGSKYLSTKEKLSICTLLHGLLLRQIWWRVPKLDSVHIQCLSLLLSPPPVFTTVQLDVVRLSVFLGVCSAGVGVGIPRGSGWSPSSSDWECLVWQPDEEPSNGLARLFLEPCTGSQSSSLSSFSGSGRWSLPVISTFPRGRGRLCAGLT